MKRYVVECVGTFFLALAICLTGQPLGIGLMLATMIYIGGHVSGAHYNPAISFAVFLQGGISMVTMLGYMAVQCLGAFFAAGMFNILSQDIFFPAPGQSVLSWEAGIMEALLTFVFCSVVLALSQKKSSAEVCSLSGLLIGLSLAGVIFIGGDISGGIFNPAVAIGTIAFDLFQGGEAITYLPIYLAGPFAGSLAAWMFYQCMNGSKN